MNALIKSLLTSLVVLFIYFFIIDYVYRYLLSDSYYKSHVLSLMLTTVIPIGSVVVISIFFEVWKRGAPLWPKALMIFAAVALTILVEPFVAALKCLLGARCI